MHRSFLRGPISGFRSLGLNSHIGLDKQTFSAYNCKYFLPIILAYVLGSFEYPQHNKYVLVEK